MKNNKYILLTAGRGPEECRLALYGIQMRFREFLKAEDLHYEIVKMVPGTLNGSIETIVFKINGCKEAKIKLWIGTLQWICKSPIRKYSKRKNWFVKCCEVAAPEIRSINLRDIIIQGYKASGPGGQHRNKVETAIRIVHQPSGTIVTAADSKSKAQNKKRALIKLEEKLKLLNRKMQLNYELDEWASKIEIERGNPTKIFSGSKFIEQ